MIGGSQILFVVFVETTLFAAEESLGVVTFGEYYLILQL